MSLDNAKKNILYSNFCFIRMSELLLLKEITIMILVTFGNTGHYFSVYSTGRDYLNANFFELLPS